MHRILSKEANTFFGMANFLVVKTTDYCNLRCKYCHQDSLTGKPSFVSMETFKNAVSLILKPSQAPVVYVQFHGGEPLLCSDEFFTEAVEFSKAELETTSRKVEFCIQTNLTLLTPERQSLLNRLGISLGFSIDGPPEINDKLRGGSRHIIENYKRVKAADTYAGAICLIQQSNWDRMDEVLKFFQEEGILSVRFNVMVPDGRAKEMGLATAGKLFNAKKTIAEFMFKTEGNSVTDASLLNAMRRFSRPSGAPSCSKYFGCEALYCQGGRSLYSISPKGDFFPCDRIAEDSSWAMGNVNEEFGAPQLEQALKTRRLFHQKDDGWAHCEACDARKICEFSCSAYYIGQIDIREVECQYTRLLWEYFLERKADIFSLMTKLPESNRGKKTETSNDFVAEELALGAFYNQLTSVETLVANSKYRVFRSGDRFYLFVSKRNKIFEIDETVAEIARFNGAAEPSYIEKMLSQKFPENKIREAINNIAGAVPEVLYAKPTSRLEHNNA